MKNERPTWFSAILAIAVLSIAAYRLDLMLALVEAVLIVATLYPGWRDHTHYVSFLLKSSVISSILILIAEAVDLSGLLGEVFYGGVSVSWILILLVMTGASMTAGMMISVCINHYTSAVITKRWMLLFALCFALAVAAVYMFPMFVDLYCSGYPVFNEDERLTTNRLSDRMLMAPVLSAIVAALPWSARLRQCSTYYDRNEMLREGSE